jgi:hypothetical protein
LAQTLTSAFYSSNPDVKRFTADHPDINMTHSVDFSKDDILKRAEFYIGLSKQIWAYPS